MELNITRFFNRADTWNLAGSVATHGDGCARRCFAAAVDASADYLFVTEDTHEDIRAHFASYGAWSDDEIAAWSDAELNAVLLQEITLDAREGGLEDADPCEPDDYAQAWRDYEKQVSEGRIAGRLFRASDGGVYFTIGE